MTKTAELASGPADRPARRASAPPEVAGALDVRIDPPGVPLPAALAFEVTALFDSNYHRYHYARVLLNDDRFRFCVQHEGRVVGFATVKRYGRIGCLSNFLVLERFRNLGIGKVIDGRRIQLCREHDLVPYSSCTTTGVVSQRLKAQHGMLPLNVKYGYRRDVVAAGREESAVSYSSLPVPHDEVERDQVLIDEEMGRVRILAASVEFARSAIAEWRGVGDRYVDVLTSGAVARQLIASPSVAFAGFDLELTTGHGGVLFQARNARFWSGGADPGVFHESVSEWLVKAYRAYVAMDDTHV